MQVWEPRQQKPGQQKGDASPFLEELLRLEVQAKRQGLGCWSTVSLNPFLLFSAHPQYSLPTFCSTGGASFSPSSLVPFSGFLLVGN